MPKDWQKIAEGLQQEVNRLRRQNRELKQRSKKVKTLIDYLTGSLSYDSSWAVYAEKIDGEFKPESPARFGQTVFENGGMLDDCELVGLNDRITDQRDEYCGSEDGAEDFYEEWALQFIQEVNELDE